jgi:cytochrome c551/c552
MSRSADMRRALLLVAGLAAAAAAAQTPAAAGKYGFGRVATPQEIAGWDIDVRPDGHGVKKGKGTVAQGQDLYDAQCASCHGTFGESNRYMAIAGGVKKEDLATGRASALTRPDGMRTLGTKLNSAATLWDYIYRAMPWANPQSLTVDQTYALTAYVLHLNEIVPADFELNERNLTAVRMPNRNGMTTAHGMASVKGKPDVQGSSCMKDCVRDVKVTSSLPEFARNQHGNLAEQKRAVGPMRGVDTTRYDAGKSTQVAVAPAAVAGSASAQNVRQLVTANACIACHAADSRLVGPSFREVGAKYATQPDAEAYLSQRIRQGGQGVWGPVPMPPQTALKEADAKAIAAWILGGAK